MKKFILLLCFCVCGTMSYAAELKDGALYCITEKKLEAYYAYKASNNESFIKKLMDKSDCFIKKGSEEVVVLSDRGEYAKLENLAGFTIWTKTENISK